MCIFDSTIFTSVNLPTASYYPNLNIVSVTPTVYDNVTMTTDAQKFTVKRRMTQHLSALASGEPVIFDNGLGNCQWV